MYSPVDLPSRLRAAPAKKRRLSAENGISSRDAISGLPTLADSSRASSSAFSSITSARAWSSSERSFGVLSSHSGSAFRAASTARSTSSAEQRGTSAIVSPVAGAITSIVSPETASTSSPPIRIRYCVVVVLMPTPPPSAPDALERTETQLAVIEEAGLVDPAHVLLAVLRHEGVVRVGRLPAVDDEVAAGRLDVPQQLGPDVAAAVAEELRPLAVGAVGALELGPVVHL